MIYSFAKRIAFLLSKHSYIKEDERELFEYGIFLVLSQVIYFSICLVCGAVLGCVKECVIFYICFMLVREYAGGFHASSEIRCFVISSISIIASAAFIKVTAAKSTDILFITLFVLAVSVIALFSPIDTEEKPLTPSERKNFRKKSLIILCILLLVCAAFFKHFRFVSISAGTAVILEGIMLTAGKLKNHLKKKKVQKS